MPEFYLDNNATTKPLDEVVEAMGCVLGDAFGNPSSPHGRGISARQALLDARIDVANLIGCPHEGIVFTSGGTEANNLVLRSVCNSGPGSRLITTAIEHSSVLNTANWLERQGVEVVVLEVDSSGIVSIDELREAMEKPSSLVSIQWANSETGTLQPIAEIGELCKGHNVPLHVDAAQAVGRININLANLPITYLTFTAHKIHGPQGVGAVAALERTQLLPLQHGGDQEGGIRPGTENLPGIVGFGAAAKARKRDLPVISCKLCELRDLFERLVLENLGTDCINGSRNERVANTTNIRFPYVDGMAMLAQLDKAGIFCSLTSACVSARPEPSHVLLAMGLSEDDAYSSIRFSFSVLNTEAEAKGAAAKVSETYLRLRNLNAPIGMRA